MYTLVVAFYILALENFVFSVELGDLIRKNIVEEEVQEILPENDEEISKEVLEKAIIASAIKKSEALAETFINYAAETIPEMKFDAKVINHVIQNGLESAFSLIMKKNVDLLQRDEDGQTCLHRAVSSGNMRMFETLLARKPEINVILDWPDEIFSEDVSVRDRVRKMTALHCAARIEESVSSAMAEALLMAGAKHSPKDSEECTPLHYCAMCNNAECAKVLLKYGARHDAEDIWSREPIYYALGNGSNDVIPILKEYRRSVDEAKR